MCHGATKLESRNYWAHTSKAHVPQQKKPLQWEAWAPQLEKARVQQPLKNKQTNMILRDKNQVTHSMIPFIEAVKPGEASQCLVQG